MENLDCEVSRIANEQMIRRRPAQYIYQSYLHLDILDWELHVVMLSTFIDDFF